MVWAGEQPAKIFAVGFLFLSFRRIDKRDLGNWIIMMNCPRADCRVLGPRQKESVLSGHHHHHHPGLHLNIKRFLTGDVA